jgi:hypothetical protein
MNELIAKFEETIGSAAVVTGTVLAERATSYWDAGYGFTAQFRNACVNTEGSVPVAGPV